MVSRALMQRILPDVSVSEGDQLTLVVLPSEVLDVARVLRDDNALKFTMLLDLCVVDYLTYGVSQWETNYAGNKGYSRACAEPMLEESSWEGPRFVVVCHLLSIETKSRIRVKVYLNELLQMPTLVNIWPAALWYEREAYDLFGVWFDGNPDCRRLLTDYGFIGYPFRKDFPMIGYTEVRYDGEQEQVVYEPVSIEDRKSGPKVIREDNRYKVHEN